MNKLAQVFEKKAFIPFITCGDPDLATTEAIIDELTKAGADLIELGIPFSDPTAEGPTIQEANLRALKHQITTDDVFQLVKKVRRTNSVPLAIMTYANIVFTYGAEKFFARMQELAITALILADVPYEEKAEFLEDAQKYGVSLISFVAPTSNDRIEMIAKEAEGFIYIVSSLGVTGTRSEITTDLAPIVESIRKVSKTPCAIGFGISSPEQAAKMAKLADGVIVGSAIVKLIAKYGKGAPAKVGEFVRQLKDAISKV